MKKEHNQSPGNRMRDGAQMHPKTWVTRPPEPRGKDELLNTKVLTLLRSIPQFPKLKKKKGTKMPQAGVWKRINRRERKRRSKKPSERVPIYKIYTRNEEEPRKSSPIHSLCTYVRTAQKRGCALKLPPNLHLPVSLPYRAHLI